MTFQALDVSACRIQGVGVLKLQQGGYEISTCKYSPVTLPATYPTPTFPDSVPLSLGFREDSSITLRSHDTSLPFPIYPMGIFTSRVLISSSSRLNELVEPKSVEGFESPSPLSSSEERCPKLSCVLSASTAFSAVDIGLFKSVQLC